MSFLCLMNRIKWTEMVFVLFLQIQSMRKGLLGKFKFYEFSNAHKDTLEYMLEQSILQFSDGSFDKYSSTDKNLIDERIRSTCSQFWGFEYNLQGFYIEYKSIIMSGLTQKSNEFYYTVEIMTRLQHICNDPNIREGITVKYLSLKIAECEEFMHYMLNEDYMDALSMFLKHVTACIINKMKCAQRDVSKTGESIKKLELELELTRDVWLLLLRMFVLH